MFTISERLLYETKLLTEAAKSFRSPQLDVFRVTSQYRNSFCTMQSFLFFFSSVRMFKMRSLKQDWDLSKFKLWNLKRNYRNLKVTYRNVVKILNFIIKTYLCFWPNNLFLWFCSFSCVLLVETLVREIIIVSCFCL